MGILWNVLRALVAVLLRSKETVRVLVLCKWVRPLWPSVGAFEGEIVIGSLTDVLRVMSLNRLGCTNGLLLATMKNGGGELNLRTRLTKV